MGSSTSSFRISDELRTRFEQVAKRTGKGKNRILTEALQEYLERVQRDNLAAEASRQSLLIRAAESKRAAGEDDTWQIHRDERGWL